MVTKRKTISAVEELRPKLIPILKKHQVARAAIFGSQATGTAKETSDVDILIEFEGEKNLLDLAALKLDLEAAINRKVDVTTYRGLHPLIRKRVLKQQVRVLWENGLNAAAQRSGKFRTYGLNSIAFYVPNLVIRLQVARS